MRNTAQKIVPASLEVIMTGQDWVERQSSANFWYLCNYWFMGLSCLRSIIFLPICMFIWLLNIANVQICKFCGLQFSLYYFVVASCMHLRVLRNLCNRNSEVSACSPCGPKLPFEVHPIEYMKNTCHRILIICIKVWFFQIFCKCLILSTNKTPH